MENLQYLFLAFSSVFIILFLYVSHLRRLTIDLDNEVKELKELLKSNRHQNNEDVC
tara:strand:- start:416 stop:583 length:168 start_codon:yes stop_codon:yes gene_type:complete